MKAISVPIPEGKAVKGVLVKAATLVGAVFLAYAVRGILLPLGLAFLLAMILDPVVDRMELRGWSRPRASAFIFGSFILISGGLAVLAFPFVVNQINTLQKGFERYFPDPTHGGLIRSFHQMGASTGIANAGVAVIENARDSLQRSSTWLSAYGMSVVANAIWIVIVPIVAFYALRYFHTILAKSLLLVPSRHRDLVQTAVTEVTGVLAKYLRGLAIVSILNGVATALLLSALGVPGGLLIGVIAGLLYSVPYIGALLTLMLTAAAAFLGGGLNVLYLATSLSILLHQIIFDQIISPRILGAHVGLHPILSIIALLVGNLLLGIVGMIIAVPVAACIQIAVLALLPKLSHAVDIAAPHGERVDTVDSLANETTEAHQRIGATEERHAAVAAAVETIEHESAVELLVEMENLSSNSEELGKPRHSIRPKTAITAQDNL